METTSSSLVNSPEVTKVEDGRDSPEITSSTSDVKDGESSIDGLDTKSTVSEGKSEAKPAPKNPQLMERCNCDELRDVICHLETKDLWDKFHELGTEMIITKSGR